MSLGTQLIYSSIFNIARSFISFILTVYLARNLNAEHFGLYVYTLALYAAIFTFLDAGFSSAYYTALSRRKHKLGRGLLPIKYSITIYLISMLFTPK